jgi:hypothetical protein
MVDGVRKLRWLVLAVGLSACGDDSPAGADRAGSGPTNDLPLWVTTPGTCVGGSNSGGSRGHWATSEERLIEETRAMEAETRAIEEERSRLKRQ